MTEETEMSKYIVYGLDGDPELPCINSAHNSADMGPLVLTVVGAGNPYFSFETMDMAVLTADEIGANFNTAPLASTDYQTNRNNVDAMWADPPPTGEEDDGINVVWKVA
jgi:hypothetical protein